MPSYAAKIIWHPSRLAKRNPPYEGKGNSLIAVCENAKQSAVELGTKNPALRQGGHCLWFKEGLNQGKVGRGCLTAEVG